ncbi:hypothetical protein [Streptomyces sp. NPDC012888]|uniref:hypothetical protein n=1 Tax=Streptomyces sp. NPDC012888 TaxID=3364855 RepID=UPI0036988FC2
MASSNSTRASAQVQPRLRIAVGRKTGAGPLVLEPPLSAADIAAHQAASHVRRQPQAA